MIENMTPQPYPLGCSPLSGRSPRYLVIGWVVEDGELLPVTVLDSGFSIAQPSAPAITHGPLRYYLPGTSVSVDGEIAVSES